MVNEGKKAFTLVEALIVVLFMGIMAYIAVPKLQFALVRKQKADTIAKKIATDLRLTRRVAVANAASNVSGYALNMTGSSPYSAYEVVNLSTSEVLESDTIDSEASCTGGSNFQFGPLGNLLTGSDTQLTVSAEGKIFTIDVVVGTGAVTYTEN